MHATMSDDLIQGKCTQIKSNCMYTRMHTLSTISTQESSQAVMDPSKYQIPYTA